YRYDPAGNTWDDPAVPDLPESHEAGTAGFLNGRMIVAGGFTLVNATNLALAWTPGANSWVYLPPMPMAVGGVGSAADATTLYAIGGIVPPNGQYVDWNQRYYEPPCATPTTTPTPPTNTPTGTATPTVTGTPPTATPT